MTEDDYFKRFLDDLLPPMPPVLKIFRVERSGKQTCVDCVFVELLSPGVLKFVERHAHKKFAEAQAAELKELAQPIAANAIGDK